MSGETSSQSMSQAELGVLPSGHLRWFPAKDDSDPGSQTGQAAIEIAFARGVAEGLIALAAKDTAADLSPTLAYWYAFACRYLAARCSNRRTRRPVVDIIARSGATDVRCGVSLSRGTK